MNFVEKNYGGWTSQVSDHQKVFPYNASVQAIELINRWKTVFPVEDTWVQKQHKVPSLLIKLDCIYDPISGVLFVYEIDERPDGMGLAHDINPDFAARLQGLTRKWAPVIKWVKSDKRDEGDDGHWLGCPSMNLDEYQEYLKQPEPNRKGLVLVRAEPWETEFHQLQNRALAPIAEEGKKCYGRKLNLWQKKSFKAIDTLPWHYGFAIKPLQGSKCKGIKIWHPGKKHLNDRGVSGISTQSSIKEAIMREKWVYVQPLIMPLADTVKEKPFFHIYRIYFGYNVATATYEPLGGTWVGREGCLIIHGSNDAIFGPLVLEPKPKK